MRRDIVHFTTKARWIQCVSVTIILPTILGNDVQLTMLYVLFWSNMKLNNKRYKIMICRRMSLVDVYRTQSEDNTHSSHSAILAQTMR